jgi:ribonuclease Z
LFFEARAFKLELFVGLRQSNHAVSLECPYAVQMSLEWKILGSVDGDNALFVRVNAGQAVHGLLFDCGEGCLSHIEFGDVLALDHVCFSHFHVDHVAGFDSLLRARLGADKPLHVWGPVGSIEMISYRLRGILWNLMAGLSAP